jgi:lysophospholipase L1-like esterase
MRYFVALAVVLGIAGGCGSSDEPKSSSTPAASTPASTSRASPASSATGDSSSGIPLAHLRVTPSKDGRISGPLYIALGDSLSAGVGATGFDPKKGFVGLVHDALPPDFALLNLGVAGFDSRELIDKGELQRATTEIKDRNGDSNPNNDVRAVTLEIGGNDLLDIFFEFVLPGRCPSVAEGLQKPECVAQLRNALDLYEPNLDKILSTLQQADPQLNIFLMTLYNPFSGASPPLDELGEFSLEGRADTPFPEGLQDIIRRQAQAHGVHLVEVYPLFEGKAHEYIAGDTIHPNDTGHRVMADAVIAEMRAAGVIE